MKPSYDKYFKYQFDANAYVQDVLKLTAWSSGSHKWDEVGQYEVLDYYSKTLKLIQQKADIEESLARGDSLYTDKDIPLIKNWIRIEAGHSIGKCVDADDNIILANGLVVKAKELIGKNVELPDIEGKNKAIFFDNGIKEVVRITLENGVQITRTLNHPVWATLVGDKPQWVNCGDLTIAHKIANVSTLYADSGRKILSDRQIINLAQNFDVSDDILQSDIASKKLFLAYLFSDYFITGDNETLFRVNVLLRQLGIKAVIKNGRLEIIDFDRVFGKDKSIAPNLYYVKIIKIEYLGLRPTVGITVPSTNTFTTFIYEHNTNLASMIVSHFFDCFVPSIGLCYAPTYPQVNDLLFKEIRKWRTKNQLQGTILKKPEMYPPNEYKTGDWWVKGKAVGDNTESIQGQHEGYMLFILDEAEGLPQYLYDAVLSMASGNWAIVVLLANPRTTVSPFYEIRQHNYVQNFRISCLNHPNVRLGYEKIKGATTRTQVLSWLYGTKCKTTEQHDPKKYTFKLDWHDPSKIYEPTNDFLFRVMGIAPPHLNYDSFFNLAQVENIIIEESQVADYLPKDESGQLLPQKHILQIGIDVARHGGDYATIYSRYGNIVRCETRMQHSELHDFKLAIEDIFSRYTKEEIEHVSIRVDATGIGWFLIDYLNMADFEFDVFIHPIQNNETAVNVDQYYDTVTEMYAIAGDEADIKVIDFGYANTLQFDLVNRTFGWVTRNNKEVKRLNKKELFKKKHKHSPDDSDGFVLAVVPDEYFGSQIDIGIA